MLVKDELAHIRSIACVVIVGISLSIIVNSNLSNPNQIFAENVGDSIKSILALQITSDREMTKHEALEFYVETNHSCSMETYSFFNALEVKRSMTYCD